MDDDDMIMKDAGKSIKNQIKQFLKENYKKGVCAISKTPDSDGKFIVDCRKDLKVINKNITSLTNEYFKFGTVNGEFNCSGCKFLTSLDGAPETVYTFDCGGCTSLTSLEGAPKEVIASFYCNNCYSLTSLEGAPEKLTYGFDCESCTSLTSLEGAPKEVGGAFLCGYCKSLVSLKGAPTTVSHFSCNDCTSLTSLEGAPKEVRDFFKCDSCKVTFTEDDVKQVSHVGRLIIC